MPIPEWYVSTKHLKGKHNQLDHGRGKGATSSDINQYFTGDVEVSFRAGGGPSQVRGRATTEKQIFGRELKDHEYAELVGAPDGLHIQVTHSPAFETRISPGFSPANIEIRAMGGRRDASFHSQINVMERKVYGPRTGETGSTMHNNKLYLKRDAPEGLGTRMLAGEVDKARKLGIKHIDTAGMRSENENGYYTWPRLGYEEPKRVARDFGKSQLQHTLDLADPNGVFSGVSTFADLFSRNQGKEFWKINGDSISLEFDLSPKSSSSKVLSRYLKAKGIKVGT